MWNYNNEQDYYLKDNMIGTVTGSCHAGVFIKLENDMQAFAYHNNLLYGTKVLCTLLKEPTENRLTLVGIDSIIDDMLAA